MTAPANGESLRTRLTATLTEARAALADLEDDNRRVRAEIRLVEASKGRRLLLKLQHRTGRAIALTCHPWWTLRTAFTHLTHRGPLGGATALLRRILYRRTAFRALEPVERRSNLPDVDDAVRWIGRARISGETLDALLCHPPSTVRYDASMLGRVAVVAPIAMLPVVWASNRGGARFTLTVTTASGWRATVSRHLDPHSRWRDRRWRRLRIDVPPEDGLTTVAVTLETTLPPGAALEHSWAVWGEPHLRGRRTPAEVRASLRSLIARIRATGLRASLSQLRDADATDLHADLYQRWLTTHAVSATDLAALAADAAALTPAPTFSVITPVYNTDPRWLRACIESVRRQIYPHWQLCLCDDGSTRPETREVLREYDGSDPRIRVMRLDRNAHISAASNAALTLATGNWIALLDHDDEYTPDALYRIARHLADHPGADIVYSDEDKLDLAGARCDPYFKPDWSPEHFLACMYTPHLLTARRDLVVAAGGFREGYEGAQDYDLLLRMSERAARVDHVPHILYHWRKIPESTASAGAAKPWAADAGRRALEDAVRRRGQEAEVLPGAATGLYRVRFRITGTPLVSLIIPTTGQPRRVSGTSLDTLKTLVRSVRQKTAYPHYEFVIVADQGRVTDGVRRALDGAPHRIVAYDQPGPFNFSHKINTGAAAAEGAHFLLLNDDIEVIGSDWLTAMLEYSQQPAIGAVGAKLLYPDGRLQHIGIVLGIGGGAGHVFHQHSGASPGYASSAVSVRNYSAVTAACLMTRREAFAQVGGFDERFAIDFNDVDFCLRLRAAGYRLVVTPFATLYHHESASFGPRTQNPVEVALARERWGDVIARDPYYHPELTREFADYRVRT